MRVEHDKGKVRHHVCLVHIHERLSSFDGHNIVIDDVALSSDRRRALARSSRTAFRKRLLHERALLLQPKQVFDLLFEGLNARVALGRVVAPSGWPEKAFLAQSGTSIADILALRAVASNLQREAVLARLGEKLTGDSSTAGGVSYRRG
jgi:hypothetical protein